MKSSDRVPRARLQREILRRILATPMAKADLVRALGVRPNSVSDAVDQLVHAGLLREGPVSRTGGRPLRSYRVNNDHSAYLGVMIDGEQMLGVVLGLAGEAVERHAVVNPQDMDPERFLANLLEVVNRLRSAVPARRLKGLCVCGDYFSKDARTFTTEYIRGGGEVEIAPLLARVPGLAVRLQSAVSARIMGERWFGKGRGIENFAYVNYGAGISASLSNQRIVRHDGYTKIGELGHTRHFSDRPCRCGRAGCLETVASVWSIRRFYEERPRILGAKRTASLARETLAGIIEQFLDQCLADRQQDCLRELEAMTTALGVAIKNLADLVAPEKIILGGSMMRAHELIVPIVHREVNAVVDPMERRMLPIPIEVSDTGEWVGALGAAAFFLNDVFLLHELVNADGWQPLRERH